MLISSTSQNTSPRLIIQHAYGQQLSYNQIQQSVPPNAPHGNILYEIHMNLTIIFPINTTFVGSFSFPCGGIAVSLVDSSGWQFPPSYPINCLNIAPNVIPAGTYNFSIVFYINSQKNYTGTNFPKTIGLYAYTAFNYPQIKSNVYYFELQPTKTSFLLSILTTYGDIIVLSSIVIVASGLVAIVKFSPSVREFLHLRNIRVKKHSKQALNDKTIQKLEEIMIENSK